MSKYSITSKRCLDCCRDLPFNCFRKTKNTNDGLSDFCRKCTKRARILKVQRCEHTLNVLSGTKRCTICGETQPSTEFSSSRANRCRSCHNIRIYKIPTDVLAVIHITNQYQCAICGKSAAATKQNRLAPDHDHHTGEFRGFLCGHCNVGIGHFKDDPDLLIRAAEYLKRNK